MRPPVLPRFTRSKLISSLKCFAAALIAMTLASRAGLPRPFWSLMTTYIVANPLAGAVQGDVSPAGHAAGLRRDAGAVQCAVAAGGAALALWTAACLYFSLPDRTDIYVEVDHNRLSGAYPLPTFMGTRDTQTGASLGLRHRF